MVTPFRAVRMSPGRNASPEIMFSAAQMTAWTMCGQSMARSADIAPSTAAPPDMSAFISSMPSYGLIE